MKKGDAVLLKPDAMAILNNLISVGKWKAAWITNDKTNKIRPGVYTVDHVDEINGIEIIYLTHPDYEYNYWPPECLSLVDKRIRGRITIRVL